MIIKQYEPKALVEAVAKLETQPECYDGYVDVQWIKDTRNANNLETGNRAYQREKVASLEWKQSLICTLLGVQAVAKIPEIHIRVKPTKGEILKFELVDGQQRITTVLDFINGEFALPDELAGRFNKWAGKTYQEIQAYGYAGEELCKKIDSYTISCKWYVNLSDLQVSHLFVEILNNTNDLKPQEKRCAVLGAFSTWVRDTARDGGTAHKQHELFTRLVVNGDDPILKYFSKGFKMGRLQVDEWLSELAFLKLKDGVENGINQSKHSAWVKTMQSENGAYTNAFVDQDVMDDLLKLALKIMKSACKQSYQNRLNPMTTQMMVLYADQLQDKYGKLDIAQYVSSFFNVWDDWSDLGKKLFAPHYDKSGKKPMPPFKQLFGGKNANAIGTIFWVLNRELDRQDGYSFGITERASKRVFAKEMIEKKWRAQGMTCYYTEQPLALEDAVGDHYVPWTQGGETVWDNLVVTSKFHNSRKGDMSGTEYSALLEQNAIKATIGSHV